MYFKMIGPFGAACCIVFFLILMFYIGCLFYALLFTDDHGDSVFSEVHKARKAIARKQKEERDALLIEEYRRIKEEESLE